MSKLYVVVGGQYGSEGKGAVAGRIVFDEAAQGRRVVNVRVGGPNAGHTVLGRCPKDCDGVHPESPLRSKAAHPWRLRQVPVGAVTALGATLAIAAGSEIDPEVLADELRQLDSAGYNATDRLFVDQSATVLDPGHIAQERHHSLQERLGSTAKGIGAARSDRIWREAETWGQYLARDPRAHLCGMIDTASMMSDVLQMKNGSVVVEGTQGYGLGLHTRNYPYTTSGDCRAVDFLAQAGISPWMSDAAGWEIQTKVVVAVRPHPIRVAGNSGQLTGETTWDQLGLPEERTTVTNKIRRVGAWDPALVREAIRANGGPRAGVVWLALTMWDTVEPLLAGLNDNIRYWATEGEYSERLFDSVRPYLADLGLGVQHLGYVGTGPDTALVSVRMYD